MTAAETVLTDALRLVLSRPDLELSPDMGLGVTEGWDSFAHIDLVLAIEESAGIEFGTEEIPEVTTVPALLSAITRRMDGGPA
ncbi:MAG: acyl carrier protein [Solirubrobacteraceae bacterium]